MKTKKLVTSLALILIIASVRFSESTAAAMKWATKLLPKSSLSKTSVCYKARVAKPSLISLRRDIVTADAIVNSLLSLAPQIKATYIDDNSGA